MQPLLLRKIALIELIHKGCGVAALVMVVVCDFSRQTMPG